jgi:hypothetical protein
MTAGELRKPLFIVATTAMLLIVLVELGSALLIGGQDTSAALLGQADRLGVDVPPSATAPSGRGIPYLVLIDVVLLYTVALMGAGMLLPDRLYGRVQGVITLLGSIALIVVALVLLVIAYLELLVMQALFLAPPFGTVAYLAIWGFFPRGDAAVVLSLLMFLKLAFAALLLFAHPRFLQNKGLVLLVLTSVFCTVGITFLHGFVPIILVSIVDDVAAIVIAILASIWGIVLLVGSIPAVVNAIRVTVTG